MIKHLPLSKLINMAITLDFEEISIWKSSSKRNSKFAKDNISMATKSISEISEINKTLCSHLKY